MKTTLRTATCAGLLVAALAACTPADDVAGSTTAGQGAATMRTLSSDELRVTAIGVLDLPPGWSQDPDPTLAVSSRTPRTSTRSRCPAVAAERDREPVPDSSDDFSRTFRHGDTPMYVSQSAFASEAEAKRSMADRRTQASRCPAETEGSVTRSAEPMEVPRVGDEQVGTRFTTSGEGTGERGRVSMARVGTVVVVVIAFDGDEETEEVPELALTRQVEKLQRALGRK